MDLLASAASHGSPPKAPEDDGSKPTPLEKKAGVSHLSQLEDGNEAKPTCPEVGNEAKPTCPEVGNEAKPTCPPPDLRKEAGG